MCHILHLSPVPVRSAVKSYFTSWLAQNLSKRVLKRLMVLTSTTWLGRQSPLEDYSIHYPDTKLIFFGHYYGISLQLISWCVLWFLYQNLNLGEQYYHLSIIILFTTNTNLI